MHGVGESIQTSTVVSKWKTIYTNNKYSHIRTKRVSVIILSKKEKGKWYD